MDTPRRKAKIQRDEIQRCAAEATALLVEAAQRRAKTKLGAKPKLGASDFGDERILAGTKKAGNEAGIYAGRETRSLAGTERAGNEAGMYAGREAQSSAGSKEAGNEAGIYAGKEARRLAGTLAGTEEAGKYVTTYAGEEARKRAGTAGISLRRLSRDDLGLTGNASASPRANTARGAPRASSSLYAAVSVPSVSSARASVSASSIRGGVSSVHGTMDYAAVLVSSVSLARASVSASSIRVNPVSASSIRGGVSSVNGTMDALGLARGGRATAVRSGARHGEGTASAPACRSRGDTAGGGLSRDISSSNGNGNGRPGGDISSTSNNGSGRMARWRVLAPLGAGEEQATVHPASPRAIELARALEALSQ